MNKNLSIFMISCGFFEDITRTLDSFINCINYQNNITIITPYFCNTIYNKLVEKYKNINFIGLNQFMTRQSYFKTILDNLTNKYTLIMSDNIFFIKKYECLDKIINYLNNNNTCGLFFLNKLDLKCDNIDDINLYNDYKIEYDEYLTMMDNKNTYKTGSTGVWPFCLLKPAIYRTDFLKEINFPYVNRFFEYHIINTLINYNYKIASLNDQIYNFIYYPHEYFFQINVIGIKGIIYKQLDNFKLDYIKHKIPIYKHENIIKMFNNNMDNTYNFRLDILSNIITHRKVWENNKLCIVLDSESESDNILYIIIQAINIITNNDIDLVQLSEDGISAGYVISKSGLIKIKNFIQQYEMKYSIDDMFVNCPNFVIHKLNSSLLKNKKLINNNIFEMNDYIFYSRLDSMGNDIKYVGKLSLEELRNLADNDPNCVGFNTLGWLKKKINPVDKMINCNWSTDISEGLYVKKHDKIVNDKIKLILYNKLNNLNKSDITFTITTCKRWEQFRQTMDNLLIKCENIEIIDRWLCVDDNSTDEDRRKMKEKYPFFDFIFKDETTKGHPNSMNIIWNNVTTTYVMHFEDDWICNINFNLKTYLDYVKNNNVPQLLLRRISNNDHIIVDSVDGNNIFKYIYNCEHLFKPELNKHYDLQIGHSNEYKEQTYQFWWWPGFSLNPSICNLKLLREKVGLFNTEIRSELFEYDYALRCYNNNLNILYVNLDIQHTGLISSYSLNNMKRYYDK